MERQKEADKMKRDGLNDKYLEMLEKQRLYFKTVKDFKEVSSLSEQNRLRYLKTSISPLVCLEETSSTWIFYFACLQATFHPAWEFLMRA